MGIQKLKPPLDLCDTFNKVNELVDKVNNISDEENGAEKTCDCHKKLDDVMKIQLSEPTNKTDHYMRGLSNGLIMAKAILSGEEPKYINCDYQLPKVSRKEELKKDKKFILEQTDKMAGINSPEKFTENLEKIGKDEATTISPANMQGIQRLIDGIEDCIKNDGSVIHIKINCQKLKQLLGLEK